MTKKTKDASTPRVSDSRDYDTLLKANEELMRHCEALTVERNCAVEALSPMKASNDALLDHFNAEKNKWRIEQTESVQNHLSEKRGLVHAIQDLESQLQSLSTERDRADQREKAIRLLYADLRDNVEHWRDRFMLFAFSTGLVCAYLVWDAYRRTHGG